MLVTSFLNKCDTPIELRFGQILPLQSLWLVIYLNCFSYHHVVLILYIIKCLCIRMYVCIWVYTYTYKLYRPNKHNTKVSKELIFIKVQCLTVRFFQHSVLVFYFTSTLYFIHMIPSLIFIQSKLKLKFPISHPIIQRKTKKIGIKCNNVGVTQSLLTDMWLMNRAWPVIRE